MKKVIFFGLIGLFTVITVGCLNNSVQEKDIPVDSQKEVKEVSGEENSGPKKFYPDNQQLERQEPSGGSGFTVTQELEVKFYLVDKYDPGICYGMPGPVPQSAINGMITRNPELSQLVKNKYGLTSDLDIYNKIKQLNGILLTKLAGGKYKFNFTDGQCCVLTAYEGEVNMVGKTISDQVTREESKQNPC